jgi:superfamily I DNA/RNA helicase
MEFRIADTFTDSLARLTGEEQKAVKTTAFDLQMNPAAPGMQFHKLDRAKDRAFWSVRVSSDIRLIVHKTDGSLLLCYVGHHDDAYQWAERRRLEAHPKTGAAQWVEIRERVQEIAVPRYVEVEQPTPPKPLLFATVSSEELLAYGVPPEWIDTVRAATEDGILELVEHLPSEAAEALLDLATGTTPKPAPVASPGAEPFEHPDAQRRFRVVANVEELERALDYPWEKWTVFLHPAQRESVERDYGGPARISGTAGTGKTIVALHRAVFLARANPDSRVLLTTFSEPLANALRIRLHRLVGNEPKIAERVDVYSVDAFALRLHRLNVGRPEIASREVVRSLLEEGAEQQGGQSVSLHFLATEWEEIVDAWQLTTWEAYRDVARLGRKTRLPEKRRQVVWEIFKGVRTALQARGLSTYSDLLTRTAQHLSTLKSPPFDFVVVDEAQDVSVAQLRFLAAMGAGRPNSLFFTGDLGQRIFQQPFSWKALGVDIRGRSRTLRINYRTSHQIRSRADHLLGSQLADVDGNVEERRGAISVFNGPEPDVQVSASFEKETDAVALWLKKRVDAGVPPSEIAVFVRSSVQLDRARQAVTKAGLTSKLLDERADTTGESVIIGTMHLAKGLEFRAIAVMACDFDVLPLQERIGAVVDEADLEDVYNTERHLLYVACTRARDFLLVSGSEPASEFLADVRASS